MRIKTYQDLVAERIRLESVLATQKLELRSEIREIKELFNPLTNALKWIKGFQQSVQPSSIASAGANAGIDILVRDKILSKANWVVRSVVPFILKRLSNVFLANGSKRSDAVGPKSEA